MYVPKPDMWSLLLASVMADSRRRDYTHLDTLLTVYILYLHCIILPGASTFVTDPASKHVYEGNTVLLNCAIKLEKNQRIEWLVDSKKLITNERYLVKKGEDTSVNLNSSWLTISEVVQSDAGKQFFCGVFEGENPIDESKKAILNVTRVPKTDTPNCQRLDVSYNEGEKVVVTCAQENTNPRVRLNIYKGNRLLIGKPEENTQPTFRYTATFEAHRSDDGVMLWCSQTPPTDEYPQRFRKNCTFNMVYVNFAPSVTINGETEITLDKQRKEQEVVYVCTSFAKPTSVTYDWYVKFRHDPAVKYYKQHNGSTLRLVLTQSTVVREVNLTCIGRNVVGTNSVTQTLLVNHDSKPNVSPTPYVPAGGPDFTWSTALILAVTGSCGLCIALFTAVIIGFYHFQMPQSIDIYGERIAQPEVYFEPKDGISSPQVIDGKHSVGVQVSEQGDIESVYTEVSEYGIKKDKDKALPENNSYSHV